MKNLGITKGDVKITDSDFFHGKRGYVDFGIGKPTIIVDIDKFDPEQIKNECEFIKDSYDTTNKCNKLPSQLLKERNELLETLKVIAESYKNLPDWKNELIKKTIKNME